MDQKNILAALVGQPNSGKSTIFNLLTRIHQEVGNYPGLTTAARSGHYHQGDFRVEVVDLPGTYSFSTSSEEERIVKNILLFDRPEVVIAVVDAANFRRHLSLIFDLLEMQLPTIICLSFTDMARRRGVQINPQILADELNVPVVPMICQRGEGLAELREQILEIGKRDIHEPTCWRNDYGGKVEPFLAEIVAKLNEHQHLVEDFSARWLAVKLLENDREARRFVEHHTHDDSWQPLLDFASKKVGEFQKKYQYSAKRRILETRVQLAEELNNWVLRQEKPIARHFSDRLDAVACHPIFGFVLLAVLLFIIFQLTFHLADIWQWLPIYSSGHWNWMSPVELLSQFFHTWLPDWIEGYFNLGSPRMSSFLRHGVFAGMGGVIQFVPVIFIMFTMLSLLEQSGYIARVAMIMDSFMRRFGLQGQSILPMVLAGGISGGCAVPAIMAARSITNFRQRLLTSLVIPMLNCGGKLPVYAMLVASCFQKGSGLIMIGVVFFSWGMALGSAFILSKTVLKGAQIPLLLEIPSYQLPKMSDVFSTAGRQSWEFLKKAGTIILAANILLWFLMSYPDTRLNNVPVEIRTAETRSIDSDAPVELKSVALPPADSKELKADIDSSNMLSEEVIENSYAARIGRSLEPVSRYAGFGWKDNVAFISGLAAKEMIVGSFATLYGMNKPTQQESVPKDLIQPANKTLNDVHQTGQLIAMQERIESSETVTKSTGKVVSGAFQESVAEYGLAKVFALLVFVMLYAPCSGTLVAIYRISNSARWVVVSLLYNTIFAYLMAVIVYQVGRLII